jgi:hypothetical protein
MPWQKRDFPRHHPKFGTTGAGDCFFGQIPGIKINNPARLLIKDYGSRLVPACTLNIG